MKTRILFLTILFLLMVPMLALGNPFVKLNDKQSLGLTIYLEARGESEMGKVAVGSVILNRVTEGYGNSIKGVVFAPRQFSCFNSDDIQYDRATWIAKNWKFAYQNLRSLRECYAVALALIEGTMDSFLKLGATHFKTVKCSAYWAKKMRLIATIGAHEFYA
jgi:spore germination cell wall hydrolase CwlJ-like protein